MQIAFKNPATNTQVVFQRGFKIFIQGLAYEVDHPSSWSRSEGGSALLSSILWHPIWVPAREIIATLPPGEHTTAAQKCKRTLDRIRQKIPPGPAPIDPGDPCHIAIDVVHKHDDERPAPYVASLHASAHTQLDEDENEDGADEDETDEDEADEEEAGRQPGQPAIPPPSHTIIDVVSEHDDEPSAPAVPSFHASVDTEPVDEEADEVETDGETGRQTSPE